jgi:dihydrolipoamide dehydrogenase
VYAALESEVTVVEMMPQLLPGCDEDLVGPLARRMDGMMSEILLETKVANMEEEGDGIEVTLEDKDGGRRKAFYDRVLVSIGRQPNSSGIGLNSIDVEPNDKGFIQIDAQRRTAAPHVFAIGDVAGEPMLAHKASHEGRVAAEVIAGEASVFEPRAIPAVVFTDPEVAWCGLTEREAKEQGADVRVERFPWSASGRATTLNRPDGLTKILTDPESGQVLGVGIAGAGAGELISEGVLAVEMGALASDIGLSIHPHPTLGETIMETADLIFGQGTHAYKPKK